MSKVVYTEEHLDWLRENYQTMNCRNLTKAFNKRFEMDKSMNAIRTVLTKRKIRANRSPIQEIKLFTPEQIEFLRENYPKMKLKDLLRAVNAEFDLDIKINQLRGFVNNHKILSGRTGFEAGNVPWNKGKTGYMGPNRTSFKPGNRPHNTKYLWHERIGKDGYIEISIPETNPHTGFHRRYRHKHLWLWEQYNGPCPAGHAVIFKDGNNRNFDLANLELVSRAELLHLNMHRYKKAPDELKPSIMALSKVEAAGHFRTQKLNCGRRKTA